MERKSKYIDTCLHIVVMLKILLSKKSVLKSVCGLLDRENILLLNDVVIKVKSKYGIYKICFIHLEQTPMSLFL